MPHLRRGILASLLLAASWATVVYPAGAAELRLTFQHGRLSGELERAPLGRLLSEVARQSGALVFLDPSLSAYPVTVRFHDLPLEEALKRICRDQSYAMVFSAERDADGRHRLTALRVYPKGSPEPEEYLFLRPVPAGPEASARPLLRRDQVDALVAVHQELSRSAAARRIQERRRPRPRGNTPGPRSVLEQTLRRARRLTRFRIERARTMARKAAYRQQLRQERQRMEQARWRAASTAASRADHARREP